MLWTTKRVAHLDLTAEQYSHLDGVLAVVGENDGSLPGGNIAANLDWLKRAKAAIVQAAKDIDAFATNDLSPEGE